MELAGFLMQVLGFVVTGGGFIFAWYRASGRVRRIFNSLAGLPARLAERRGDKTIAVEGIPSQAAVGIPHCGPLGNHEERLRDLETELVRLDERIDARVENALGVAREKWDADNKVIELSDIYVAIGGLVISLIGFVFEHASMLQRIF